MFDFIKRIFNREQKEKNKHEDVWVRYAILETLDYYKDIYMSTQDIAKNLGEPEEEIEKILMKMYYEDKIDRESVNSGEYVWRGRGHAGTEV